MTLSLSDGGAPGLFGKPAGRGFGFVLRWIVIVLTTTTAQRPSALIRKVGASSFLGRTASHCRASSNAISLRAAASAIRAAASVGSSIKTK
jgi:hypothetical protein